MNILFISKMSGKKYDGVTVAVTQLLNSICNYAQIYWMDLSKNEFEVSKKVNKINNIEEIYMNIDIAVFEDPFNTIQFCKIARKLRNKKIPYVIVPHGCFNKKAINRKKTKKMIAIKTFYKSFLNGCTAIQYLTQDELNNSLHFNKDIIIPNGISESNYIHKNSKIRNICYIGRKDIDHKGLDLLIKACSKVQDQLRKNRCHIDIYGPNSVELDNKILELINQNNVNDIISNNGPLFGSEKEKVLLDSDAFIQTSRYEGFPMSILEAFSYGMPVIITEGTNLTSMVSKAQAGFTCKTCVDDIANTIIEAINAKNIRSISTNSKKLSEKFSWSEISKLTINEYKKLLG